jgi:hypothetical protein
MRRAESPRPITFELDGIYRDDVSRAGDAGALHGIDTDAADAHHHDGVACAGFSGAYRAAVARGHTAAEWHSPLAASLTSTSDSLGPSSSTSSTSHFWLGPHRIAALVFMCAS